MEGYAHLYVGNMIILVLIMALFSPCTGAGKQPSGVFNVHLSAEFFYTWQGLLHDNLFSALRIMHFH